MRWKVYGGVWIIVRVSDIFNEMYHMPVSVGLTLKLRTEDMVLSPKKLLDSIMYRNISSYHFYLQKLNKKNTGTKITQ